MTKQHKKEYMSKRREEMLGTEQIRHGTFGPIVWDVITGETRYATQDDMDTLPVGPDLTPEEEDSIED